MKCISLWAPWAHLIPIGAKRDETRHWHTPHRGPILIHAAKKWTREFAGLVCCEPFRSALVNGGYPRFWDLPLGAIIGFAKLDGVFSTNVCPDCGGDGQEKMPNGERDVDCEFCGGSGRFTVGEPEGSFGDFSANRYAWKMTNPCWFREPIPYRGMQSLFDVPDELVAEQMAMAVAPIGGAPSA